MVAQNSVPKERSLTNHVMFFEDCILKRYEELREWLVFLGPLLVYNPGKWKR